MLVFTDQWGVYQISALLKHSQKRWYFVDAISTTVWCLLVINVQALQHRSNNSDNSNNDIITSKLHNQRSVKKTPGITQLLSCHHVVWSRSMLIAPGFLPKKSWAGSSCSVHQLCSTGSRYIGARYIPQLDWFVWDSLELSSFLIFRSLSWCNKVIYYSRKC